MGLSPQGVVYAILRINIGGLVCVGITPTKASELISITKLLYPIGSALCIALALFFQENWTTYSELKSAIPDDPASADLAGSRLAQLEFVTW